MKLIIIFTLLFNVVYANQIHNQNKPCNDATYLRAMLKSHYCGANFFMKETWAEKYHRLNAMAVLPIFTEEQLSLERWIPLPKYEGFYDVSTLGRIRSLDRMVLNPHGTLQLSKGRIIKEVLNYGYCVCTLSANGIKKRHRIHVLIAQAFIPNPENKPQVNHIDTIKTHNWVDNLEWSMGWENQKHARENIAWSNCNSEYRGTVFSPDEVIDMRRKFKEGETCSQIAKRLNAQYNTILKIVKGENWKHLLPKNETLER